MSFFYAHNGFFCAVGRKEKKDNMQNSQAGMHDLSAGNLSTLSFGEKKKNFISGKSPHSEAHVLNYYTHEKGTFDKWQHIHCVRTH